MQTTDFTGDMPGAFVRTMDGHDAFLPHALPPGIIWGNELVNLLSEADRAMGRLAGVGTADIGGINPNLLIRPFMRREAVLSSQIEGTQASLSDLLLFEELPNIEDRVPDVREVANYVRAGRRQDAGRASQHSGFHWADDKHGRCPLRPSASIACADGFGGTRKVH